MLCYLIYRFPFPKNNVCLSVKKKVRYYIEDHFSDNKHNSWILLDKKKTASAIVKVFGKRGICICIYVCCCG